MKNLGKYGHLEFGKFKISNFIKKNLFSRWYGRILFVSFFFMLSIFLFYCGYPKLVASRDSSGFYISNFRKILAHYIGSKMMAIILLAITNLEGVRESLLSEDISYTCITFGKKYRLHIILEL